LHRWHRSRTLEPSPSRRNASCPLRHAMSRRRARRPGGRLRLLEGSPLHDFQMGPAPPRHARHRRLRAQREPRISPRFLRSGFPLHRHRHASRISSGRPRRRSHRPKRHQGTQHQPRQTQPRHLLTTRAAIPPAPVANSPVAHPFRGEAFLLGFTPLRHSTTYSRVPHPSRFVRRVGSYNRAPQSLFSSLFFPSLLSLSSFPLFFPSLLCALCVLPSVNSVLPSLFSLFPTPPPESPAP